MLDRQVRKIYCTNWCVKITLNNYTHLSSDSRNKREKRYTRNDERKEKIRKKI